MDCGADAVRRPLLSRRELLRQFARLACVGLGGGLLAERSSVAKPASSPLRVGVSLALSGRFASDAQKLHLGYRLWAEEVNRAEGLLGRPIQLIVYDDFSQSEKSARNYVRLIREDRVDLLLGPYGSIPSSGAVPVIEEAGYPCVFPMAANPRIWAGGRKWSVQMIPPAPNFMDGVAELLATAGMRTLAIVFSDTGIARDVASGLSTRWRALGGEVVFSGVYPMSDGEMGRLKEYYMQVQQKRPDVVGHLRHGVGLLPILRMARDIGLEPKYFAWSEIDEVGWVELPRQLVERMVGSVMWLPQMRFPGNRQFVKRFTERFVRSSAPDQITQLLDHHPPAGYAAGQLMEMAVQKAGSFNRVGIRDALFEMKAETVFGRYQVDARGAQVGKI
ncbi:MAG: amino acid ABC transporter substrate-binding protein, partial [Candidatus Binatia bacterium]